MVAYTAQLPVNCLVWAGSSTPPILWSPFESFELVLKLTKPPILLWGFNACPVQYAYRLTSIRHALGKTSHKFYHQDQAQGDTQCLSPRIKGPLRDPRA
eukprot:141188-Pelagomonas_calceolata.AAC.1